MSKLCSGYENLPEDFIHFISKNYRTIDEIEKKVEQFKNDSWSEFYKKLGCRDWRNMRLRNTKCDSVDSCFSDKDVKKVIRAKLRPKLKKLASNEHLDVSDDEIKALTGLKKEKTIDYSYLSHNFPLAYFAPDYVVTIDTVKSCTGIDPGKKPKHSIRSTIVKLIVEGSRVPLFERTASGNEAAEKTSDQKRNVSQASSRNQKLENIIKLPVIDYSSDEEISVKVSPRLPKPKVDKDPEPERSRQLLSLTLPPLHQSVLTLLGQKSGVKGSPRSLTIHELGSAFDSANNQKAKLRRHGRKKKTKDDGKDNDDKEGDKQDSTVAADGDGDDDELQETQLNTLHQDEEEEGEEGNDEAKPLPKSPSCVTEMKSLRDILDETLCKDLWSQKEMESLKEEIEKLSVGLRKYQTEFQSKSISVSEDSWLMFPRTCTHTTATFGIPSDTKVFKDLEPIEYLRNYVTITEPRLHLYNLIYQRYRILENPTGTSITTKSLQRALGEVLGRPFEDEEMRKLKTMYLRLDHDCDLDTNTFSGICAFTERVFGRYELEKRLHCRVCADQKRVNKERCHVKRKSELESMDLFYLSNKIKFGETNETMSNLIEALVFSEA